MLPDIWYASFYTNIVDDIGLSEAPFSDQMLYYYQLNNCINLSIQDIRFLKLIGKAYRSACKKYDGTNEPQPYIRPLTKSELAAQEKRLLAGRRARHGK